MFVCCWTRAIVHTFLAPGRITREARYWWNQFALLLLSSSSEMKKRRKREENSREKDDAENFAGLLLVGHRCGARYVGRRRREQRSRSTVRRDARAADFAASAAAHGRGLDDADRLRLRIAGRRAGRRETDPRFPDEFPSLPGHADGRLRPPFLLQGDVFFFLDVLVYFLSVRREIDSVKAPFVAGPSSGRVTAAAGPHH